MIEAENINGSPKEIPNTKFGSIFNGEKFIFFESDEERENYLAALPIVFDLEAHKKEMEAAVDAYVDSIVRGEYWYKNEGELAFRASYENEYQEEAQQLISWHMEIYRLLEKYLTEVTTEHYGDIETLVNNLPRFNYSTNE